MSWSLDFLIYILWFLNSADPDIEGDDNAELSMQVIYSGKLSEEDPRSVKVDRGKKYDFTLFHILRIITTSFRLFL